MSAYSGGELVSGVPVALVEKLALEDRQERFGDGVVNAGQCQAPATADTVRPSRALAIIVSTSTTGWWPEVVEDPEELVFVFFGEFADRLAR